MGDSVETRVRVVARQDGFGRPELEYIQHHEYPDETQCSPLMPTAAKALKGVQAGDIVVVVWSFDRDDYPIISARRITGTLEGRVEALEAALKGAGIDIPTAIA